MRTPALSIVLPYYCNPMMLEQHYATWLGYPYWLKSVIEVIVVDDGSPDGHAAAVRRLEGLPTLRIYRVLEDRPWHQHGARNLGAHEAAGDWLYLGDMDHSIPSSAAQAMIALCNREAIYTFGRVDAPDMKPRYKNGRPHHHPNTFLMPRQAFWRIGGYDEDLTGYGTDSFFRARLSEAALPLVHREDIRIVRYPREVIPDASTRTLPRKEGRPASHRSQLRAIAEQKRREGLQPTVLNFPWERVV